MNIQARLRALPLPASALLLLAALALGALDYNNAGWVLFGLGALTWARLDARHLADADRYGLPPALALLAYPALAGAQASTAITFALALHALVVFMILMSKHLATGSAQPFSQQNGISRSI
jgi:hypothetical protein